MDTQAKLNLVNLLPWWQLELLDGMHQPVFQGDIRSDPYITYEALAEKLVGHGGPAAQDVFRALVICQGGRDPGL